jgi:phosphomannomutase
MIKNWYVTGDTHGGMATIARVSNIQRNMPERYKPEETGLPASNVLQFYNEAGDVVTVRPSGTEPKIKFYFGIKGADAVAKNEALRAQFSK